ncbi:hypothetical protein [Bacillus massiliigorillae]|uniref:hypothetical protein n=1 Tax=Bacillus massiliigorillae TaxID=1243664 RepID=UPI0003AA6403|nr:hypothetical protein [Bacillus massiliigorillae]
MIERIISFFSENIFFLFIILGIVSSLFGKEKKDKPKHKRPEFDPTPRPTAQPVQKRKVKEIKQVLEDLNAPKMKEVKQALEDLNPKKVKELVSSATHVKPDVEQEISNSYQELLEQQAKWEKQAAALEAKANAIKQSNPSAIQSNNGLNAFHKNELVNGMIMSEVLGPPRCKKPLQRLKK